MQMRIIFLFASSGFFVSDVFSESKESLSNLDIESFQLSQFVYLIYVGRLIKSVFSSPLIASESFNVFVFQFEN